MPLKITVTEAESADGGVINHPFHVIEEPMTATEKQVKHTPLYLPENVNFPALCECDHWRELRPRIIKAVNSYDELKKQNDDLLAACKAALWFESLIDWSESPDENPMVKGAKRTLDQLRAAIARAS